MDKIYSISADRAKNVALLEEHTVVSITATAFLVDAAATCIPKDSLYKMGGKLFGSAMYGDDPDRLTDAWDAMIRQRAEDAAKNYLPFLLRTEGEGRALSLSDPTQNAEEEPLHVCYLLWGELNDLLIPWFALHFPGVEGVTPRARGEITPVIFTSENGFGAWGIELTGAGRNEDARRLAAKVGRAITIGKDIVFPHSEAKKIASAELLPIRQPPFPYPVKMSFADADGVYFIG